jgi:hypothetical protein
MSERENDNVVEDFARAVSAATRAQSGELTAAQIDQLAARHIDGVTDDEAPPPPRRPPGVIGGMPTVDRFAASTEKAKAAARAQWDADRARVGLPPAAMPTRPIGRI